MRIAVVHNRVKDNSLPDEQDVLKQADAVFSALVTLGHETICLPCDLNLENLKTRIEEFQPHIIFNLAESLDRHGRLIHVVPGLLDALKIPYTGAPADTQYQTSHKIMAKERMRAAGLPTPDWINPFPHDLLYLGEYSQEPGNQVEKQWIIKSLWEHASLGIDEDNIIFSKPENIPGLLKIRSYALAGACFAEIYIEGREFNLSLLGNGKGVKVLPPAEILFKGYDHNMPKIVGYKAKWMEDTYEYHNTPRSFDFLPEDKPLLKNLEELAMCCWKVFGLRGYARVDFRVDIYNNPYILEINANPCISPDAGFAAALDRAGISYKNAVEHILKDTHVPNSQDI